jgi:hypothetical protein
MANAELVTMGVCNVEFGGNDLGYTKGNVKATYSMETIEKTVDQKDTPIDEVITKQVFEVTVPLAEKNLEIFANLFPGATLTAGGGEDAGEHRLELSGAAGASLSDLGDSLVIKPIGGDEHDWLTFHNALPIPSIEASYDKENVQIFEVKFKAVPNATDDWVTFGKTDIATS